MAERPTTKKPTKPRGAKVKAAPKKRAPAKTPKKPVAEAVAAPAPVRRTYLFAVGRRKTAVARIRLYSKGSGQITVNEKPFDAYFPLPIWQRIVRKPLELTGYTKGDISIKVAGGGVQSQAESARHGIARALLLVDPAFRKVLKPMGLLTRDARVKERKKYGLKRARRAPQWQKR
ncbi:MAG: 30S ribosomal protein S9 [Candidatus Kerfeldbacteria bacterium]|nr:30S ribosomal protein S9 [Candidatus Kerfeldbacteria bacterium]